MLFARVRKHSNPLIFQGLEDISEGFSRDWKSGPDRAGQEGANKSSKKSF
jgi:hypothetical protein